MEVIGKSLIIFSGVILIVSLVYIISINRTKERLARIENNLEPSANSYGKSLFHSLKIALLFIGGGIGFVLALILDEYVLIGIDNPAIYPGCVLIFAGIGLVLFHKNHKGSENE